MIWPRQNRSAVHCRQGISSANDKLEQLIARHEAMISHTEHTAPASDANGIKSLHPSTQAEQDLTACKADIVSMVHAIHSQWKSELDSYRRFESFAGIARDFGVTSIYEEIFKSNLKVS